MCAYKRISPIPVTEGGTGNTTLTTHGVLIGEGTSAITQISVGTNGQILVGATSADPAFATLTSSGSTLTYTTGANSLNIDVTAPLNVAHGGTGATTLTGVLIGNGTSAVTANTVTQHDVLVGGASNAITSVAPSSTSGIPLVSNGVSADPSFTTAVVAGGGTGNTTFTAYSVICAGTTTTGAFQNVSGVGTAGQILTSNGAAALPTWQGGGLIELATQTASNSASISFTSVMSSTYKTYLLVYTNVQPVTNATTLNLQISTDNGSTYIATGYQSGQWSRQYNSAVVGNSNSTTTFIVNGNINSASNASGHVWLMNNGVAFQAEGSGTTVAGSNTFRIECTTTNAVTSVNAIQLTQSSGNINTGTFTLYGVTGS